MMYPAGVLESTGGGSAFVAELREVGLGEFDEGFKYVGKDEKTAGDGVNLGAMGLKSVTINEKHVPGSSAFFKKLDFDKCELGARCRHRCEITDERKEVQEIVLNLVKECFENGEELTIKGKVYKFPAGNYAVAWQFVNCKAKLMGAFGGDPSAAANALEAEVVVQPPDAALRSTLLALVLPLIEGKDAAAKEELQQQAQQQVDAYLSSHGHSGVRATVRVDKHASFAGKWRPGEDAEKYPDVVEILRDASDGFTVYKGALAKTAADPRWKEMWKDWSNPVEKEQALSLKEGVVGAPNTVERAVSHQLQRAIKRQQQQQQQG